MNVEETTRAKARKKIVEVERRLEAISNGIDSLLEQQAKGNTFLWLTVLLSLALSIVVIARQTRIVTQEANPKINVNERYVPTEEEVRL